MPETTSARSAERDGEHYLEAVRRIRPQAFVIENVPEFQRSAQFAKLLTVLRTDPELSDYGIGFGVLNAADYGVPQSRRRGIFVAVKGVGEISPDGRRLPGLHRPRTARGPGIGPALRDGEGRYRRSSRPDKGFDPYVDEDGVQHLHFGRRPLTSPWSGTEQFRPGATGST